MALFGQGVPKPMKVIHLKHDSTLKKVNAVIIEQIWLLKCSKYDVILKKKLVTR